MRRTNVVRLVVGRDAEAKLRELALWTAKCWNEVNWLRMQQFKEGRRVDFNGTEKAVYAAKYKAYLKVNASQVCRKNAEAWRSFFSLIKAKREGRLPKWLKPRPPGYWADGRGKHKLMVLVRNDRYVVDEEARTIYLKDFGPRLEFRGRLKWRGKQGRLEIFHDGLRWYAAIPVEVEVNRKPKGDGVAGVDLGIANLAAVAFSDGTWALFKGGSVLAQYEYYSKKIARVQRRLALHKQQRSKRLRALHLKRSRFLRHALSSMARRIVEMAYEKGVSTIKVGYPKEIAKRRGNKLTVGFWSYNYVVKRMREIAEEYGIKVELVNEARTSIKCSLCGEVHENGRIYRGLYRCPRAGKAINADLNAAINIMREEGCPLSGASSLASCPSSPAHIPESRGGRSGGSPARGIGVTWLKAQPLVHRWTSGAGWVVKPPTSYEALRVKAVHHKPVNRPREAPIP